MTIDSSKNGQYYENDRDSSMTDFPYAASFKDSRTKRANLRNIDLGSVVRRETGEFSDTDPFTQNPPDNDILNIPSYLQYPQDLGKNRRHHHFIVFNIYQGESDSITAKTRVVNQAISGLLAKGQIGGGGGLPSSFRDNLGTLKNAGFSDGQLQQIEDEVVLIDGLSGDAGLFETANNLGSQVWGDIGGVFVGAGANVGDEISDDNAAGLGSFISSLGFTNVLTDKSGELNKIDYRKVGITGKKVNRPKWEQNILLQNRRFGYANVKSKDTICLYMPLKISFNDQLIYSEEDMGSAKATLNAIALQKGGFGALLERFGSKSVSDVVNSIADQFGIENVNVQGARNAFNRNVVNPRREMQFKDVGIRSHTMTFEFSPKNLNEAEAVQNIIRMFRYHAYPRLRGGGGHFFKFPAEFEATYYTITDQGNATVNDNLPKLPRLALTSVSVDYSASGDYKTFYDGKPAFIRLDLGFQEMEQLTNEHIVHGY